MAYRRKRFRRRNSRSKRVAGRVARKVARRAYRRGRRMSKRRLAKTYANKCGQVAFRAVRKLGSKKAKRYGRKHRRGRR